MNTITCLDLSILYARVSLARCPVSFQMDSFNRANAVGVVCHYLVHVGPAAEVENGLRGIQIRCLEALR